MVDDNGAGMSLKFDDGGNGRDSYSANNIISLDADGFTVDDNSGDADPNANTIVYNFVAFG
jgi:hypothetical protein